MTRHGTSAVLALSLLLPGGAAAGPSDRDPRELADMPLEALFDVEVTLATREERPLHDAAAAVFVVTAEDIRRSGATTLPEALRLVPGLQVARAGASTWVIGSRGFADQYSNKLLVLIDGRTVYSPMFSGVYWETQDIPLESVERIEVIRGPGAALWGANAVNGIINVVMRSAREMQGALASGVAGSHERIGSLRWGGALGGSAHYALHARYADRDAFLEAGPDPADAWDHRRAGARLEWESGRDALSLDAGLFDGGLGRATLEPSATPPYASYRVTEVDVSGGHLLGRWKRTLEGGAATSVQASWDRARREDVGDRRDTLELHAQHGFAGLLGERTLVGLGYRRAGDRIDERPLASFVPSRAVLETASAFVHDEIRLPGERAVLALGAKLEHHTYSGFELQPSARLAWDLGPRHLLWGAVSGAARTPSRAERGMRFWYATVPGPDGTPADLFVVGNPDFRSERVVTWEAGYRGEPVRSVSVDMTVFRSSYDGLRGLETGDPLPAARPGGRAVVPMLPVNSHSGTSSGLELAAGWSVSDRWRLSAAYSWLRIDLPGEPTIEGSSPEHQLVARSLLDLPGRLEADATLYAASALESRDVPGRVRIDLRLGWRPTSDLELDVVIQNLSRARTTEFLGDLGQRVGTDVPRSAHFRLTWRH